MDVNVKPTFIKIEGKPAPLVELPYQYTAYHGSLKLCSLASPEPVTKEFVEQFRKAPQDIYNSVLD